MVRSHYCGAGFKAKHLFEETPHVRAAGMTAVNLLRPKRLIIIILSTGNVLIREYDLALTEHLLWKIINSQLDLELKLGLGQR